MVDMKKKCDICMKRNSNQYVNFGINKLNLSNAALLEIQQGGKPQYDEVLKVETNMAGGFDKPGSLSEYGCDQRAFGTPGAGGQNAFADVESEM